ncbi:MAG TPA: transaldolase [Desulfomonilaceae bacterium]|nr:transaldolase [Desulfomonilaceae bacterium]
MSTNPLLKIQELGQSVWLDLIRRSMIVSGELRRLIKEDGLRGVTSNPDIFEKAIVETEDYASDIRSLSFEDRNSEQIYETLATEDIRQAADEFRPVFDELDGRDGFVSLEVSPKLALDTDATVREARRLWQALNRPNVFIKVPATKEGLVAIKQLIGEGINVNVTLLFGLDRYREVAESYISGLETAAAAGKSLKQISSVASFFLSRIDVLVDPMLEKIIDRGGENASIAKSLRGETAIACAKAAYRIYKEIFIGERWENLTQNGARTQRVLWASTSTKNPAYSDVKYVEALIGPDTVNTLPLETLKAYRDHGQPAARLEQDLESSYGVLEQLSRLGISLDEVSQQLENEGIEKFVKPFEKLLNALEEKRREALGRHTASDRMEHRKSL